MSLTHWLGRLAWWRRDDDPAARARQALAAMRAESPRGDSVRWLDDGGATGQATERGSGSGAGGGTD